MKMVTTETYITKHQKVIMVLMRLQVKVSPKLLDSARVVKHEPEIVSYVNMS